MLRLHRLHKVHRRTRRVIAGMCGPSSEFFSIPLMSRSAQANFVFLLPKAAGQLRDSLVLLAEYF